MSNTQPIKQLRKELRNERRRLTPDERESKSRAIRNHLRNFLPFQQANDVAVYHAISDEVDTKPIIELCVELGKQIYLPIINTKSWRKDPMLFFPFVPGESLMRDNQFGIPEPVHQIGECSRGTDLSFICAPLVGFNSSCDRIGMGGGYYDRTFANRGIGVTHLVGLAFSCQQTEFDPAAHDVPMDAIITEDRVLTRR